MFNISIIIPTYNRKLFLIEAIDSVFNQTYQNLELIIIDDGSSDKSIEYIKKKYPSVKIYKQSNKGVSSARNKGIKISSNNWIVSGHAILSKIDIIFYDLNHTVGDSVKPNQSPKVLICPKEVGVFPRGDGDPIANVSVFH